MWVRVTVRRDLQRPSRRQVRERERKMVKLTMRSHKTAAESAHDLKKSTFQTQRIDTSKCCTDCCTNHPENAPKRPGTLRNHLYFTITYTKLDRFVIDRSSVQVRSSAPLTSFFSPTALRDWWALFFIVGDFVGILTSPSDFARQSHPESRSIQDVDRSALSSGPHVPSHPPPQKRFW